MRVLMDYVTDLGRARRRGGSPAGPLPARRAAGAHSRGAERRVRVRARKAARYVDAATDLRPPPPAEACVCDAPARRRGRPAHDPGAPRPQLALDHAALQPRRWEEAATGL